MGEKFPERNDFSFFFPLTSNRGPEQEQAFEQIKQEIVYAVALGPVRTRQDMKNVLYTTAEENGPFWSL